MSNQSFTTKRGVCPPSNVQECADFCDVVHVCVELERGECQNPDPNSTVKRQLYHFTVKIQNCSDGDLRLNAVNLDWDANDSIRLNIVQPNVYIAPGINGSDGVVVISPPNGTPPATIVDPLTVELNVLHISATCGQVNTDWVGGYNDTNASLLVQNSNFLLPPGNCCISLVVALDYESDVDGMCPINGRQVEAVILPACLSVSGTKSGTCCVFSRSVTTPGDCPFFVVPEIPVTEFLTQPQNVVLPPFTSPSLPSEVESNEFTFNVNPLENPLVLPTNATLVLEGAFDSPTSLDACTLSVGCETFTLIPDGNGGYENSASLPLGTYAQGDIVTIQLNVQDPPLLCPYMFDATYTVTLYETLDNNLCDEIWLRFHVDITDDTPTTVSSDPFNAQMVINTPMILEYMTPANTLVFLPLSGNVNVLVDWDDGSPIETVMANFPTHNYVMPGTYNVRIAGCADNFNTLNGGAPAQLYLTDVFQYGELGLQKLSFFSSMLGTGSGGSALSATDVPQDTITDMSSLFEGVPTVNPDTSAWNVDNVTNMSGMFRGASIANPDTSGWNTSSVTNMSGMFSNALVANPNTSGWDTSNVMDMTSMFSNAPLANPNVINWDVSNVTFMANMFNSAVSANPNVGSWMTGNVMDMNRMFFNATSATLLAGGGTTNWDTSSVVNMEAMFSGAVLAQPDTSGIGWNTSNVTNMADMFNNADSATPVTNGWNVSNVTNMSGMFANTALANPDVSGWNVNSVVDMSSMFSNAALANPDVSGWLPLPGGPYAVVNMQSMFTNAFSATLMVGTGTTDWNTSSVMNMAGMFNNAPLANPDVSGWDVSSVTTMASMFNSAVSANPDVGGAGWITGNVMNMNRMFLNATSATLLVGNGTTNWDTSSVTNMEFMFSGAVLAQPDTSMWNTASVANVSNMFNGATSADPDMTTWDLSSVTGFNFVNMLNASGIMTPRYDIALGVFDASGAVNQNPGVIGTCYSMGAATTAHGNLLGKGWTLTDLGQCP